MNTKTFFFWSGVGVLALVGAYVVIRGLMRHEQRELAEAEKRAAERQINRPRNEMGFHAIMQQESNAA